MWTERREGEGRQSEHKKKVGEGGREREAPAIILSSRSFFLTYSQDAVHESRC